VGAFRRPRAPRAPERLPSRAVSTATKAAAPAGSLLDRVERTAWRVPLPTRQLFVTLALVAAGALAASGLIAGWVAARNADTIADAREQGLELATAATDFRTRLATADATAAATLIAAGLESTESRTAYDEALLTASQALTEAGLVATEADREDISQLASGLVTYAGLVETSRANTRLGFPVGSAYLNQARDLANDDLVPRSERLRRVGEQRMARAANSVGGPVGALAVVLLVAALAVLLACALVIAGRTRRIAHPALLGATVAVVAALVVVFTGIAAQSRELRQAATGDIDAYVAANAASSSLSNLRVTEISAVAARGSGGPLYDQFDEDTATLLTQLTDAPGDPAGLADLYDAVGSYTTAVVDQVRATDDGGNNQAAALLALSISPDDTGSADAFQAADAIAAANAEREADDLADRFDAAGDADIQPIVPIALGVLAAVLAAAGTLARGRKYR
jgi:hypothetical protein